MSRGRAYFQLLQALEEPACPICALLLDDSRAYLDTLFYESVLDVSTRLNLMQSFGLCAWHSRQIVSLPEICAPNVGFSIFASDVFRKLDYVSRALADRRVPAATWKFWRRFRRTRRLAPLLKERRCPACDHLQQFEFFHLQDLLEAAADTEFFAAYRASRGICLPHLMILEETGSSHANFPRLLEVELVKLQGLRNALEEFLRKQDFRLSDQITAKESRAWQVALEVLSGHPGIFANEMEHDMFQRSRANNPPDVEPKQSFWQASPGRIDLLMALRSAQSIAVYLREPLPESLFQAVKRIAQISAHGVVEAIAEDITDTSYLRTLHDAGFTVFYGLALPRQTTVFLDRRKGFVLDAGADRSGWRARAVSNAEDLCLNLIWHKFGVAVALHGTVTRRDCAKKLICVMIDGKQEQWCRFDNQPANRIPTIGREVDVFGWKKWCTSIIEVLPFAD